MMNLGGAELYDELWQLADDLDEPRGYVLAHVSNALGLMRVAAMDLFEDRDGRPGYSQMLDIERLPASAGFGYLGQIVGVRPTVGAADEVQRDEVRRKAGKDRGRPSSTIAKVKATLTGDKVVRVVEGVWTHTIITRTSETPNPAATYAAMLSDKPEGDLFVHIVSDAPIIDEWTRNIDATTADIDSLTLADVT